MEFQQIIVIDINAPVTKKILKKPSVPDMNSRPIIFNL